SDVERVPRERLRELGCSFEIRIERACLATGTEEAEHRTGERASIGRGRTIAALGREDDAMPCARQEPPRHGDFAHAEIAIGTRNEGGRHDQSSSRVSTSDMPILRVHHRRPTTSCRLSPTNDGFLPSNAWPTNWNVHPTANIGAASGRPT